MKHTTLPPVQTKPLSAAQMRISESKRNQAVRKKATQIGYVVGANIGN
jgi:hypothetical protein